MFRIIRAVVIAVVIAAGLLGGASVASADPGPGTDSGTTGAPLPINVVLDITWE